MTKETATDGQRQQGSLSRRDVLKATGTTALTGGAIVAMSSSATAANAHFIRTDADCQSDGDLDVCFKVAGLGNNESITVTATGTVDATWVCCTGGGNNPQAENKIEVTDDVSTTGTFGPSGKNGQITNCPKNPLVLSPPTPSDDEISCGNGQTLTLLSATYSNVVIDSTKTDPEPVVSEITCSAGECTKKGGPKNKGPKN
ncbi:twin-arginine translocation signal domain-containing protein [Halobacteriaceae archaeon GCM10025711]